MTQFSKPLKPISLVIFFFLMSGILLGNYFPDSRSSFFLVFLSLSFLLCLALKYYKKAVFIIVLFLVCFFGYFSIQKKLYPDLPSHHISNHLDFKKRLITGRVVSFVKHYGKKKRLTILCNAIETKDRIKKTVTGRINLSIYGLSEETPSFGDIIQFESPVKPLRNFMNPGGFDYQGFLKLKGIYGSAYTEVEGIKILTKGDQAGFFSQMIRKIEHFRTNFFYFILNRTDRSDAGKILASLVTGKKEVIAPDLRDLFSQSGVSHLFAISGLHLSIVGSLFFFIFYRVLAFIPTLTIPGRSKKIAGVLTLFPLTGYAVFTGFSPSTQRALLMVIVLIFSFISEKEKDVISSLSVAGILMLIIDSSALFSISFQLSFLAVVFIIQGLSLLKNNYFIFKKNLFAWVCLLACVTFFANIGTFPLTAHYFNTVSFIAIVSNLILIPVIGFAVLPLGLISLSFFAHFPGLADFFIQVSSPIILFSISLCKFFVSIPFSWSRTATWQWTQVAAIYLFLISLLWVIKGNKKIPAILFASAVLWAGFNFSIVNHQKISNTGLRITIFDVGQGSSSLIQTPEGENILVDGGGFFDNASFDTGRFVIAPFLWLKGIRSLDYVILTHPESDHLNGLVFILNYFDVQTLVKNGDRKDTKSYEDLIKISKKKHLAIYNPLTRGKKLDIGATQLIFLDSSKETAPGDFNNNSLVFRLVYKEFSMLFPGDIMAHREESIIARSNIELRSDILLSPHHGSSTSSTKFFLDKVQPKSVIISCGWHNRYGFPHKKVLKRYKKMGTDIFRTDEDGAVFISSDGAGYEITTYKGG